MTLSSSPFDKGLKLMTAHQELAARNLVNLIEMISTSSHRYAEGTKALSEEAMRLMSEAAQTKDVTTLSGLQKQWGEAVIKYSKDQTHAGVSFLEQCGQQALDMASNITETSDDIPKDS
jgi:hypothetical protein